MKKLLFGFLIICLVLVGYFGYDILNVKAATFGDSSMETISGNYSPGITFCSKASPASSGTVTSMSFYTSWTTGTSTAISAIYSDNAGQPGTLLANSSNNVIVPTSPTWLTVNVSLSVTGGVNYWLCDWSDAFYSYLGSTGNGTNYFSATYPTWPTNPSAGASFNGPVSLYATYTPGVASTSPTTITNISKGKVNFNQGITTIQ